MLEYTSIWEDIFMEILRYKSDRLIIQKKVFGVL